MFDPLPQSASLPTSDACPESSSDRLLARTSVAPTPRVKASKASDPDFISRPSASSENAALVGSLLRTALTCELGVLTPCSMHWKRSATPAGRSWYVLRTSAPTTNAPGPGSSAATSNRLPTPMAMDGQREGAGGGSGSTYPMRMILSTPRASDMRAGGHGDTGRMGSVRHQLHDATLATPRKTDADRGFRGDVLSQLHGHNSRHAGMLGTPTANPAPRGSTLRREKGEERSAEDTFDRTLTPGEMVHFLLPTPTKTRYGSQSYPEEPSRKRPSLDSLIGNGMKLPTPRASDAARGPEVSKALTPGATGIALNTALEMGRRETLPTPTERNKRMDTWSPAYDRRKSPTVDAVIDGAMTGKAPDKWQYARQIAELLTEHGLSGASQTLPIVYEWLMGFPNGWLPRALLSAVREGHLPQVSSSKPTGTQ